MNFPEREGIVSVLKGMYSLRNTVSEEAKSIGTGAVLERALKSRILWTSRKQPRGPSFAPGWPRGGEPRRNDAQNGLGK